MVDAAAGARMSVAEALTNMVWARISGMRILSVLLTGCGRQNFPEKVLSSIRLQMP